MTAYFIHVAPPPDIRAAMKPGVDIGKWCIFLMRSEREAVWGAVCEAVQAGRLWREAKISTDWGNRQFAARHAGKDASESVICVYTYDASDAVDVWRIRGVLRELGLTRPLGYKTDADTAAGIERWAYRDAGWAR